MCNEVFIVVRIGSQRRKSNDRMACWWEHRKCKRTIELLVIFIGSGTSAPSMCSIALAYFPLSSFEKLSHSKWCVSAQILHTHIQCLFPLLELLLFHSLDFCKRFRFCADARRRASHRNFFNAGAKRKKMFNEMLFQFRNVRTYIIAVGSVFFRVLFFLARSAFSVFTRSCHFVWSQFSNETNFYISMIVFPAFFCSLFLHIFFFASSSTQARHSMANYSLMLFIHSFWSLRICNAFSSLLFTTQTLFSRLNFIRLLCIAFVEFISYIWIVTFFR